MISRTDRAICGTCQFWTGNREPTFDKNGTPKVDIVDVWGCCQNTLSRFDNQSRKRDAGCIHYYKWTEIL